MNSLRTLCWSLDGLGDSYVLLDAARNNGSGSGDMFAYIPVSAFAGVQGSDYVYLYGRFGDQVAAAGTTDFHPAGAHAEGGFEEWALVQNLSPVPEMSALYPIVGLLAAIGFTHVLRRRRMAQLALANIEGYFFRLDCAEI